MHCTGPDHITRSVISTTIDNILAIILVDITSAYGSVDSAKYKIIIESVDYK